MDTQGTGSGVVSLSSQISRLFSTCIWGSDFCLWQGAHNHLGPDLLHVNVCQDILSYLQSDINQFHLFNQTGSSAEEIDTYSHSVKDSFTVFEGIVELPILICLFPETQVQPHLYIKNWGKNARVCAQH